MKEEKKDRLTILTEKMAELQEKGRKLAEKEARFRGALGLRLKTPPRSPEDKNSQ